MAVVAVPSDARVIGITKDSAVHMSIPFLESMHMAIGETGEEKAIKALVAIVLSLELEARAIRRFGLQRLSRKHCRTDATLCNAAAIFLRKVIQPNSRLFTFRRESD